MANAIMTTAVVSGESLDVEPGEPQERAWGNTLERSQGTLKKARKMWKQTLETWKTWKTCKQTLETQITDIEAGSVSVSV